MSIWSGSQALAQQTTVEKPVITRLVVANVWPGGYSEVSSLESLSGFRIVTNIDFSVFAPGVMLETDDAIYDFFILCSKWTPRDVAQEQQYGYADARGFPRYWPQQIPPRTGPARYVSIPVASASGTQVQSEGQLFDLLHRYYQANRIQIEAHARQRETDERRATAAEAARRALIPTHFGPPVFFKRFEQVSPAMTPTPR